MKISTKGRYAVRLMLDVAIHGMDKNVSMRDVAERQNISIKYLEQIVSILTRVGYLKSVRGAQGGYRLTKAPSEYTIGDILRTTEGTLSPVSCLEDEENTFGEIVLGGHELSKSVTVSWKLQEMAVSDFIPFIQEELGERIGAAKAHAIVRGNGTDQPTGIITALKAQA